MKILAPNIPVFSITRKCAGSRDNATRRLFELRDELLQYFREKNYDFHADLESTDFVAKLVYPTFLKFETTSICHFKIPTEFYVSIF